jgi:hypothetical protein
VVDKKRGAGNNGVISVNSFPAVPLLLGCLLVAWATIFVAHEISAVQEMRGHAPEPSPSPSGRGVQFGVPVVSHYDYFDGSREAFLLLHAWVLWLGAWLLLRKVPRVSWLQVSLLGVGVAVLVCGHSLAWWLGARGASVGIGY